jgi:serine phosphatase RsbU (regulator of sigma subunit)
MAHLDVGSGRLRWVNAGHSHPLLLRGYQVVRALDSPTTLPIGFGGGNPQVSEEMLEPGDRVLFFTDGITEQHSTGAELLVLRVDVGWASRPHRYTPAQSSNDLAARLCTLTKP